MSKSSPVRKYYSAQEISDLMCEFGADPALVIQDADIVMIELSRGDDSLQLDFGPSCEFYDSVLCRYWVFVPSAPHRACDRWNEFPIFGTFSVVYDENDAPVETEAGFVIRSVLDVRFDRCKSEIDLVTQILMFWFGLRVMQQQVVLGHTDFTTLSQMLAPGDFNRWWYGEE